MTPATFNDGRCLDHCISASDVLEYTARRQGLTPVACGGRTPDPKSFYRSDEYVVFLEVHAIVGGHKSGSRVLSCRGMIRASWLRGRQDEAASAETGKCFKCTAKART